MDGREARDNIEGCVQSKADSETKKHKREQWEQKQTVVRGGIKTTRKRPPTEQRNNNQKQTKTRGLFCT
jgi:hypothetical protein